MQNKLVFFPEEDIIHFSISNEEEADSVELSPNITAELNKKGDMIGIEILKASSYIRDNILISAQAKLLEKRSAVKKVGIARSREKVHVH
ncbi:MAG: DUF2283 domain-containing protein [Chitinivibrionales bacterium]|nr:DUF2283 domain-containing protein [Chitinivibrionales bacterium]